MLARQTFRCRCPATKMNSPSVVREINLLVAVEIPGKHADRRIEIDRRLILIRRDRKRSVALSEQDEGRKSKSTHRPVLTLVVVEIAFRQSTHLMSDVVGVG